MNPDQLTPDQVNMAIAELCGWTKLDDYDGLPPGHVNLRVKILNYHSSLDAMATAEATLTEEEMAVYQFYIHQQVGVSLNSIFARDSQKVICATAAQRARAFLLAKHP